EPCVQHNLIRGEGRLPALRELTQSAPVEKTAALSTELRGPRATLAPGSGDLAGQHRCNRAALKCDPVVGASEAGPSPSYPLSYGRPRSDGTAARMVHARASMSETSARPLPNACARP